MKEGFAAATVIVFRPRYISYWYSFHYTTQQRNSATLSAAADSRTFALISCRPCFPEMHFSSSQWRLQQQASCVHPLLYKGKVTARSNLFFVSTAKKKVLDGLFWGALITQSQGEETCAARSDQWMNNAIGILYSRHQATLDILASFEWRGKIGGPGQMESGKLSVDCVWKVWQSVMASCLTRTLLRYEIKLQCKNS
jgi:hypothetical protein